MKMNMLITWTSCGKLIIVFSRSCFCLNQSACRSRKTIPTMKSSFHPVYRYIFCRPSRRSGQIIGLTPRIIYSLLLLLASFSYVNACALSCSSFVWQHSPLSSFSFECVPQHFFRSIGTFHILLCRLLQPLFYHTYRPSKNTLHTYQNVPVKNSGNYSHNSYI